jgi:hypothetical protein
MVRIINHPKRKKRVNKYSVIGSILLVSTFLLFAYQVITAFLGMGTSDEFVYNNIRLVDVLDEKYTDWINSISFSPIQSIAKTISTMPLALLSLFGSVLFFLIHAFKVFK